MTGASLSIDGTTLGAVIAIVLGVVLLAVIITRLLIRDHGIRIARAGVFVERERIVELPPAESDDEVTEQSKWPGA